MSAVYRLKSVEKIVEGADARCVTGQKTGNHGVKRNAAKFIHPLGDGRLTYLQHEQIGSQQVGRINGDDAARGVLVSDQGCGARKIKQPKLFNEWPIISDQKQDAT